MENPTQVIVLVLALALAACKPGAVRSETPKESAVPSWVHGASVPDTAERPPKVEPAKFPIGRGLFRDSSGTLYLKTKNRRVLHPSFDPKTWPDSIFHSTVSLRGNDVNVRLSEVVDTATFSRVDSAGVYFEDSALIYVYSTWPYPRQFFALKKARARYLGADKGYLLVGGVLYSQGQEMEGVDTRNLKILRIQKSSGAGTIEFIIDGKKAFIGPYPLDEERLKQLDGLADADRRKLRRYIAP